MQAFRLPERVRRLAGDAAVVGALAWGLSGVGLWFLQEELIFPAPDVDRDVLDAAARDEGADVLDLVAEDGTPLYGWRVRAPTGAPGERKLVLVFHGNGESLAGHGALFQILGDRGWDALMVAYHGYPGSGGSPSEAALDQDGRAAWAWAVGPGGYHPDRIVVYGVSIGGGVAADLVAGPADPAGLVLDSTFTSLLEIAQARVPVWPVRWLLRHPFRTRDLADRLDVPVLVLHSTKDRVVPIDLGGRALAPLIPGAKYVEVDVAQHGYLPLADRTARAAWLAFLGCVPD